MRYEYITKIEIKFDKKKTFNRKSIKYLQNFIFQESVKLPDFVPTPIMQLKAGQRIEHSRFGYGKIIEISGEITDLKAKILFDNHGEKILLLKYAKIRAVNNC